MSAPDPRHARLQGMLYDRTSALRDLVRAVLAYDTALRACGSDPVSLMTFRTEAGESLAALYMRMIVQASGHYDLIDPKRDLPSKGVYVDSKQ